MKLIYIFFFFLLFFHSTASNAESWKIIEWKEIIEKSEVIVLVEFISEGDFQAKAIPIKIYKGDLKTEEIWVTNYSSRFGPMDTKFKGDRYILFLRKSNEEQLAYYSDQLKEQPELKEFIDGIKFGYTYNVFNPITGELKVDGQKVQYDLLSTANHHFQKYYSLKEFEAFLLSIYKSDKAQYHKSILKKVLQDPTADMIPQYLMMLYLTEFNRNHPIFSEIAKSNHTESLYALTKLLSQFNNEYTSELLINILNKSIPKVQVEIVGILEKVKYTPAIPELLALLETDNRDLFIPTVNALNTLGSREFIHYINTYLESGKRDLVFDICRIIKENDLTECIPSLMHFVSNHDKELHPSMDYTISNHMGLARFNNDTVTQFLYEDFLNVVKLKFRSNNISIADWVSEYMEVFVTLKNKNVKPYLFDFMFDYYGFDNRFKSDISFFEHKRLKEDSIKLAMASKLQGIAFSKLDAFALIEKKSDEFITKDYSVKIHLTHNSEVKHVWEEIISRGIDRNKIILAYGNSTYVYGARSLRKFRDPLMHNFLSFIMAFPDQEDLQFLLMLKKYGYATTEDDVKLLENTIDQVKEKLMN